MDIEKALCPTANQLQVDEDGEGHTAIILDAELDQIQCTFNQGGAVWMDTDGYEYIVLTEDNLRALLRLIDEAEK